MVQAGGGALFAAAISYPQDRLTGVCIYAAALYTPAMLSLRLSLCLCGSARYEMRFDRVKCWFARVRTCTTCKEGARAGCWLEGYGPCGTRFTQSYWHTSHSWDISAVN